MKLNPDFYKDKRVLLTGHTGFKGIWLSKMLTMFGAEVTGYALESPTADGKKVFVQSGVEEAVNSVIGDIRNQEKLCRVFGEVQPEIVLHLAAQPIVLESYKEPLLTYETNVMGTVNVLECVRQTSSVKSFLNVTTDKVYENKEWPWGYRENEPLDGYDPYSNSKSCSELITHSYKKCFFADGRCALSTARAGNVIGGGDFSVNRIVPDCLRAAFAGQDIEVRNPYSTRPYQHVLEPLYAYLMIAMRQSGQKSLSGYYNIGPRDEDCINTGDLADYFVKYWGDNATWENHAEANAPHEASFLKLDCTKARTTFGWEPEWHVEEAIRNTVDWYKAWNNGENMYDFTRKQIQQFTN